MLNIALLIAKIQTILIDNPELPFVQRIAAYQELNWKLPADHLETVLLGTADSGLLVRSLGLVYLLLESAGLRLGSFFTHFVITDLLTSWRAISIWQSVSDRFMPLVLYFLLFCGFGTFKFCKFIFLRAPYRFKGFSCSVRYHVLSNVLSGLGG